MIMASIISIANVAGSRKSTSRVTELMSTASNINYISYIYTGIIEIITHNVNIFDITVVCVTAFVLPLFNNTTTLRIRSTFSTSDIAIVVIRTARSCSRCICGCI